MRELELIYLNRIAQATEASASSSRRLLKEVRALVTWVQRLALIAALWASGLGLHLSSEQAAELIVVVIRSWAKI